MTAIKTILIVMGVAVAIPILINFLDWIVYHNESPEERRIRKEREREKDEWL